MKITLLLLVCFISCQKEVQQIPSQAHQKETIDKELKKDINALKEYALIYNPKKIDFSTDNSINDYDVEYILFNDKYADKKALRDEITNIFLLKLYLFHISNSHQGYDLLTMRKGQSKFIIDYFIFSNNIKSNLEFLNSAYPYTLLSESKEKKTNEIERLIAKIKEEQEKIAH